MSLDFAGQLEQAKDFFYACRLVEAYHLFRRYFDRIPFRPEPGHAMYIGMFVRTLAELGKIKELEFYVSELERWYAKDPAPEIAYPLAVVYRSLPEPKMEKARELFEAIVRHAPPSMYRAKAKMMLAHYYDWQREDSAACRRLVESLSEEPLDDHLRLLADIWRVKILKDGNRLDEAVALLDDVMSRVDPQRDWYGYYCSKVMAASVYLSVDRLDDARAIIEEVRGLFEGRKFKSLKIQMDALEEQIRRKSAVGILLMRDEGDRFTFQYGRNRLTLRKREPAACLLGLLRRNRLVAKSRIVQALYGREYRGGKDDHRIYYHIHALRKKLMTIGLPAKAIASEADGYRLVPVVQLEESEQWT